MLVLANYQRLKQIYQSNNSIVYRGIRTSDQQPIILKLLKQDYPNREEILRYQQEYEITQRTDLEGICQSFSLENYHNTFFITFEDIGGKSLNIWMDQGLFKLEDILKIAQAITEILIKVHRANIIHKDINPYNIIYHLQTQEVKLIDFGISTILSQENYTLQIPNLLEGTLAYMSPEQTGRINCCVDYRTDLYSLGVTLYELLTGQLPFQTNHPLELVHCHIAKQPLSPIEINSAIPQEVSNIVMKLMAKTAEERYQSAVGVKADLEYCLSQLHQNQQISRFQLARYDINNQFKIPNKLYGRESEIQQLISALERASEQQEMMLVAGYSGIGKSVLVQEFYKNITQKCSYFISGKFEQYQREIPYSAIVNAFKELVKQLFMKTEVELKTYRDNILSAIGANGQVLIDIIPEIQLIIGQQPPVPKLETTESLNRFNLVFQNFIQVFTTPFQPLVIFLDDLQWADSASLKLIQVLISHRSPGLLLIGAYRDNEVNSGHILRAIIEEITRNGLMVTQVNLSSLNLTIITQIIVDTLYCPSELAQCLADLLFFKTRGNPFFIKEFFNFLYTEKLIEFDFNTLEWNCKLAEIEQQNFTDNIIELMSIKINKLTEEIQATLKMAACIGNRFDLKTLAQSSEQSIQQTARNLWGAITAGLIIPINHIKWAKLALTEGELVDEELPEYKFVHDQVQQAAISLITPLNKPKIHHKIGKILLKNTDIQKQQEQIFDIVNQLNLGRSLISSQSEIEQLLHLNLEAGKKAKASNAYKSAFNYLQTGQDLVTKHDWDCHYKLVLSLYTEAAETAYLEGQFKQMERIITIVQLRAETALDQAKIIEVKILALIAQGQPEQAILTGITFLKKLNIIVPYRANQINLVLSLLEVKIALFGKKVQDLVNLPLISDPDKRVALQILSKMNSAAYLVGSNLFPLIAFKQVALSLKYGNCAESIYAYSVYGLVSCGVTGEIESGFQFGQLALKLLNKFNTKAIQAKVIFVVNAFINHWKNSATSTLNHLLDAYHTGLETGELEYATYALHVYCLIAYFSGQELSKLESQMSTYTDVMTQLNQEQSLRMHQSYYCAVLYLLDKTESPSLQELEIKTENCYDIYLNRMILSYLFEQYDQALVNAVEVEKYMQSATASLSIPYFYFYDSLNRLALCEEVSFLQRTKHLRIIRRNQKKIRKWMHHSPTNYSHKYLLIQAEQCRVLGKNIRAMDYYDQAIQTAKENNYLNEVAITAELTTKFYLSQGKKIVAKAYLQEAYYYYQQWGAMAKVKHLENKYHYLTAITQVGSNKSNTTQISSSTRSDTNLDNATLIKASQAISSNILLDQFLSNLMEILMENAGSQTGCLILIKQDKLVIEARGIFDPKEIEVLQSIPIENYKNLSQSIVNYVLRTKEIVVLHDAVNTGDFVKDSYIQANHPKSILCAPLIHQGQLVSIVYLENNLTTGAFTPAKVNILQLLSGQAAISIENAKLYTEVRENESRFAQFLEAMPVGVGIIDASGKPYYTNRIAQQLLGERLNYSLSNEQFAVMTQAYLAGTQQLYPVEQMPIIQALKGESTRIDDLEIHRGDQIIPLEVLGMPIYDEKGNIIYAIAAFQDITERKKAEAERQKFMNELFNLNQAYERFVPGQFLQFLNKNSIVDVQLGDQVQLEMSVLFSDIRNFTTLSELMTPTENFQFINSYLSQMEPVITAHQGFIDKYIGDAIMALFSGAADNAVQAAIAMLDQLQKYNQSLSNIGLNPIQIGIGINTGSLMLGTVGGERRMEGTVISDAVNLAARIESLTKEYGISLLISQQTFSRLQNPDDYAIRQVDQVRVKGKSELVTVYEVFDADPPTVKEKKLATLPLFTKAYSDYHCQAFLQAAQRFEECLKQNPGDRIARIYLKRSHAKL
ncbi:MAG: AAA family ATPase [Microcoleaceae cyanobacterium]